MIAQEAKKVLDTIVGQVFGYQNPFTLEQFMQKYAFDVRLPSEVYDSTTGEKTWASSTNPTKFITRDNARKRGEIDDFMLPKRELNNIQDILAAWSETNYTSTERYLESINIHESDTINSCENVYRSQDCTGSKNVLFCDGAIDSEFVAAQQRSIRTTFSIRVEDSQNISNSFSVVWSNKVTNSFFINDCFDVSDSMFCSHLAGKRFCIANMQYTEEEYNKIRKIVIHWILTN
jgi:hypothetical protein